MIKFHGWWSCKYKKLKGQNMWNVMWKTNSKKYERNSMLFNDPS
jgi:hypothetical protein